MPRSTQGYSRFCMSWQFPKTTALDCRTSSYRDEIPPRRRENSRFCRQAPAVSSHACRDTSDLDAFGGRPPARCRCCRASSSSTFALSASSSTCARLEETRKAVHASGSLVSNFSFGGSTHCRLARGRSRVSLVIESLSETCCDWSRQARSIMSM